MKKIAEYDVAEYIQEQIKFFQNDKQEFLVSKLWDEEREVESVTDKEIKEHFYDDVWIGEQCYEDFTYDIDEEFRKYIGNMNFYGTSLSIIKGKEKSMFLTINSIT